MDADHRFFLGRKMQLAFLVGDMDAALDLWTNKLGVGPFVVFDHAMGNRHFIYRGERSPVDLSLAISYVGDTQIELICPSNDAPSIYSDEAKRIGTQGGVAHHIAFWPDDMALAKESLLSSGFEEVATIQSPSGDIDVHYFSSPPPLGVMLEIVPFNSARRVYFSKIKELCESKDSSQAPMRYRDKNHFLEELEKRGK